MKRILANLFVASALTLAASGLYAAGPDPRSVSLPWVVIAGTPSGETTTVSKGQVVWKQRLLPFGYATLAQDATDAKTGNLVASSGTALLQLQTVTGKAYCVAAAPKTTALARARPGSPYLRACFLDADGNGAFDSSAEYDGAGVALPSVSGRLPKRMHVLTKPAPYTVRSPEDYAPAMFAGIKFDGFAALGGAPVFVDVYGTELQGAGITRAWPRGDDGTGGLAKSGVVLLLGARLTVLEGDGTSVKVRVDQGLPAGRFGIAQTRGSSFF